MLFASSSSRLRLIVDFVQAAIPASLPLAGNAELRLVGLGLSQARRVFIDRRSIAFAVESFDAADPAAGQASLLLTAPPRNESGTDTSASLSCFVLPSTRCLRFVHCRLRGDFSGFRRPAAAGRLLCGFIRPPRACLWLHSGSGCSVRFLFTLSCVVSWCGSFLVRVARLCAATTCSSSPTLGARAPGCGCATATASSGEHSRRVWRFACRCLVRSAVTRGH